MRDQLDRLVDEMLRKGILYDDARQAIERRFITRALSLRSARPLIIGIHRNTLTARWLPITNRLAALPKAPTPIRRSARSASPPRRIPARYSQVRPTTAYADSQDGCLSAEANRLAALPPSRPRHLTILVARL